MGLALLAPALVFVVPRVITLGAVAGMGVVTLVQRARAHPYSRGAGWLGAAIGTAATLFASLAIFMSRTPPGTFESIRKEAAVQRQAHPARIPEVLRRFTPGGAAAPFVQARTDSLTNTPGFFWFSTIFGGVMIAVIGGVILGSLVWGVVTLTLFGATGRWPPPGTTTSTLRPYTGGSA